AAAHPDDDFAALDDAGRHCDGVSLILGRDSRLPHDLAGFGIEGSQSSIDRGRNDLTLIESNSAIHNAAADSGLPYLLVHFRILMPHFLSGTRIDGVNHAP